MSLAFAIKTGFAGIKKNQLFEGAVLFLLTVFLNNYAFAHVLGERWFIILLNLFIFPCLIWAALRFGVIGAATTSAILAFIILLYAITGTFSQLGLNSNLEIIFLVQVYVAMASIPSILLAALITERKQAEETLRESEDKFKQVFDRSVIGISITRPTGEILVNQAICEMLGYSQEELKNRKWQDITHPEDLAITQEAIDLLISGQKESTRFFKRYLHKNGSVVWTEVGIALSQDQAGRPLYQTAP